MNESPFLFFVCMFFFFLLLSVFRLQTQIWGQVVRSIIGSSTTRSSFPSTPPERSEPLRRWTERSEEIIDVLTFFS